MTVSTQLTKRIYAGNGLNRTWAVDFPVACAEDIHVFITSPSGEETEVAADFELNATADTLTYPTLSSGREPLATGWSITLLRRTPLTQQIDLLRQGELDAEVLEDGYDKLTLVVQELAEQIDRCVKYPVSSPVTGTDTEAFLSDITSAKQGAVEASSQAVTAAQSAAASAQAAAEAAAAFPVDLPDKANASLDNLSASGKNLANWSNNVTTCLSYIPQDVKVTLSGGTLTLKGGSKLYVPNGAGVFEAVTTSEDISITETSGQTGMVFYLPGNATISLLNSENCYSGSTAPSGSQYMAWYDTTNNSVKLTNDNGSTWQSGYSLPFCVCISAGSSMTQIVNVFQGFGYIGSTVFVLPGVKGYIPNGYNADGSLNNTPFETTSVLTTNAGYNNHNEVYSITNSAMVVSQYYASQNDKPTTTGTLWYKPKMYRVQNDSSVLASNSCLVIETFRDSNGKITTFYPHTVMRVLDYNEKQMVSSWGLPSKKYIDLTLSASNSVYTAPADGYVVFASNTTGTQFLCLGTLKDENSGLQNDLVNTLVEDRQTGNSTYVLTASIQVNAGQKFYAAYNVPTNKVYYFRFIYTNGSAPAN